MHLWRTPLRFLVLIALMLVAASPARAAVEIEPNDTPDDIARQTALTDGAKVNGTLAAMSDYDGFRLVPGPGAQARVEVTITNTSGASTGAALGGYIGNATGEEDYAATSDDGLAPGASAVISATLEPGTTARFYVQFLCESEEPEECPATVPGATWSASVKVRSGSLLGDAGGKIGTAVARATASAQDDAATGADAGPAAPGAAPAAGGKAPATCTIEQKAVRRTTRKLDVARRAHKHHATPGSKRKLKTAKTRAGRAKARLTSCTTAADLAAAARTTTATAQVDAADQGDAEAPVDAAAGEVDPAAPTDG